MELFTLQTPFFELVIRAALVYLFLLVILRISGKRELGEMSAMELVSIVMLGDALQNSMIGKDQSLVGGFIVVAVLVGLSNLTAYLGFKSKKFRRLAEGDPTLIVRNGKMLRKNMDAERLTKEDLLALLRGKGVESISEVKIAIMESSGTLSVITREDQSDSDPKKILT
jgi:uncharacterized membrane protein YcaP (DUF421 family)